VGWRAISPHSTTPRRNRPSTPSGRRCAGRASRCAPTACCSTMPACGRRPSNWG
jgi:hypothetical protein